MLVFFIILALGYNLHFIVTESIQSFKEENLGVGKMAIVFLEIMGIFVSTLISMLGIGFISIFFIPDSQWYEWPLITRLLISNFIGLLLYSKNKGH